MKKKNYWPIAAVIIIWLVFSKPYFADGLMPFPSKYLVDFFPPWSYSYAMPVKNNAMPDVVTQLYPWKKIVIESWKIGQVPYWNPYQFGGNTLLAGVQAGALSPFNLLFFILSFNDAWSILILLQPLLAGVFMYLFVVNTTYRTYGTHGIKAVSQPAALAASISFMFCGFIVTWMAYGTLAYAVLYLPLLLYAIDRWVEKQVYWALVLIAFCVPLTVFGGHVQTSMYVLLAGVVYGIYRTYKTNGIYGMLGAMTLGSILSLPQILPAARLYQQSVRSDLFGKGGEVIPGNYLITFLSPDFFGNPVTRNDWFGHYAEWAGYAGVIPLMLASAALLGIKANKVVRFWTLFALFAIFMAYSSHLVGIVVSLHIPVLSTSAAARIIVLSSFSIAILSAYGFDQVVAYWNNKIKLPVQRLSIIWMIVLMGIWILLLTGNLLWVDTVDAEKLAVARRNLILPSLLLIAGLGTLILVQFIAQKCKRYQKVLVTAGMIVLVGLTAVDMLRFAGKWMPFDPVTLVYPELGVISYLKTYSGYQRVYGNPGNALYGVYGLYGLEGYDPLYVNRYGEFIRALSDGQIKTPERSVVTVPKHGIYTQKAFNLMGVSYLMHAKADAREVWAYPYWKYPDYRIDPVYSDDQYEVFLNEQAYPRAYLVYSAIVVKNDQEIIDIMFDEKTDLRRTVVLEKNLPVDFGDCAETQAPNTAVDLKEYTPNTVTIQTQSSCPAILVLTDTYYPDWKVYIDDTEGDIHRADFAFRAVVVPEGIHTVEFIYENRYL